MSIDYWAIMFETGEYEDKQCYSIEQFDSKEKAEIRLSELRADLESSGCDKPLPEDWYDNDEIEDDRRWRGFMVDYTGAQVFIRGPLTLNVQ